MKVCIGGKIMSDRFCTLYNISMNIVLNNDTYIPINSSDIVSLSFIHNYDTNMFPIIRVRLYSDLAIIQKMLEFPDAIYVRTTLNGGVYKMNDDLPSPQIVTGVQPVSFEMKGYIENKNIPSSVMDQYENGIRKSSSLNDNVKSPIEIYCYDEKTIHRMKQKTPSIYNNVSLTTAIQDILSRNGITSFDIETLNNQTKYEQILIPNLDISDAIAFFDDRYGMYNKGAQMYGDYDKFYISNSNVNNGTKPIPIYVRSFKSNDDMTGMTKSSGVHNYQMITNAPNVSVITETDVERVLNSPELASVNLNSLGIDIKKLSKLFTDSINKSSSRKVSDGINKDVIDTPHLLHKNTSEYVLQSYIARLDEKITRVDVSGSGFDIGKMKINTRYNIIFETAIRGLNINNVYRASYICHVLTNLSGELFSAQTTMNLCSN